ncbi:hypothetical protein [Gloeobacter kilaueensis]|uniref:Uncharacterized protein n=1 Tax=Gloeobacter kilaueensis (strain ATCC BAA-2537 / CCAP 1431/1 / ULC 316 / JS1) TaxID=1183438 RepID=U5QCP2_GLOK1|nr:hypothetical protein [Gloeobacter kilaueensis]AGY56646.1 hypothetical protein GKIL_0399 [Gloeobacter kilaueensis JS1]
MLETNSEEKFRLHLGPLVRQIEEQTWQASLLPCLLEVLAKGAPKVHSDTVGHALAVLAGVLQDDLNSLHEDVRALSKLLEHG